MRVKFVSIVCAGLMLPLSLGAGPEDKPAIVQTIQSQIAAFQRDDFEQAFTYASRTIQGLFRSPDAFGVMVQRGYPMVHRPAQVQFLGLRQERGLDVQRVQVTDAAGRVHLLDYFMLEGQEGWKINGVELLDASAFSA